MSKTKNDKTPRVAGAILSYVGKAILKVFAFLAWMILSCIKVVIGHAVEALDKMLFGEKGD